MSYSAFARLKEHCELEVIKTMSPEEINFVLNELNAKVNDLRKVAKAMREWIDAVPNDIILPAMPGFDRDWADGVIDG